MKKPKSLFEQTYHSLPFFEPTLVGMLEVVPQQMNQRPPSHMKGRNDLETLFLSPHSSDWIKISEMLLGPVPEGFRFEPKHQAKGYSTQG